VDFDVVLCDLSPSEILRRLMEVLPGGIKPLNLKEISLNGGGISAKIQDVSFEVRIADNRLPLDLEGCVQRFQSSPQCLISKVHKGKTKTRDLKL
jgi:hypothetical protein